MHLPVAACCRHKRGSDGSLRAATSQTGLVALVPVQDGDQGYLDVDRLGNACTTAVVGAIACGAGEFANYAVTSGTLADNESMAIARWVATAFRVFTGLAGVKAAYQAVTSCPCVPRRVVCCGGRFPVKLR